VGGLPAGIAGGGVDGVEGTNVAALGPAGVGCPPSLGFSPPSPDGRVSGTDRISVGRIGVEVRSLLAVRTETGAASRSQSRT
jgi:hypothetical protein